MSAISSTPGYRNTIQYGSGAVVSQTQYGAAADKVFYPGAIVVMNSSGYVQPATTATGLLCLGRFSPRTSESLDTTGLAAGGASALVQSGTFYYANSTSSDAITIANRGQLCYLVDDQTVALTSGGGTRSPAGIVIDVDTSLGVAVQMGFASGLATQNIASIIADPGSAGAIPVLSSGVCNLVSAGVETRTVADPSFVDQRLTLNCDTHGGDITVTFSHAFDSSAHTHSALTAAGQSITVIGTTIAGALRWALVGNNGTTLS